MRSPLRPVDEHARYVAGLITDAAFEDVRIADALGRTLVVDIVAPVALPGFDNSAMDGYAVMAADIASASTENPVGLPVAEDIPAGRIDSLTLTPGTAHRIMTGAAMPKGANAVVPVEHTDGGIDTVTLYQSAAAGASVRVAGSDITVGDIALPAGTALHSAQIGLLAALGISTVTVPRPLHVVVLSTGSELVEPGNPLRHGQIYESNGAMLNAAVRTAGGRATDVRFVPDNVADFRARLDALVDSADAPDLILTSGGVSAGAYEVVKDALLDDTVEFTKVAMQPGMPQGAGYYTSSSRVQVPIITLPGNPVSAQVSFEIFVRPPLRRAMRLPEQRPRARAFLTEALRTPIGKRQFRRGIVSTATDGTSQVAPIGPPSSHHLRFLASANALIDMPEDATEVPAGESVAVIMIDQ